MANEFKHKDPCTTLTQAEYIGACGDGHIFASQAVGDLLYADSTTVLNRLARASSGSQMLQIASCKPAWTATPCLGATSWANMNHAHGASCTGGTVCANVLAGTTLKSTVVNSSLENVGTLSALTVDDVAINGKVVTMTGSACDTIVMTAAANGPSFLSRYYSWCHYPDDHRRRCRRCPLHSRCRRQHHPGCSHRYRDDRGRGH